MDSPGRMDVRMGAVAAAAGLDIPFELLGNTSQGVCVYISVDPLEPRVQVSFMMTRFTLATYHCSAP